MIRVFKGFVLLALATLAQPALADNHGDPIMDLEQKWADALLTADMETVGAIMHKDFRLVRAYSEAPPLSKEVYIGLEGMSVRSTKLVPYSVAYHDNVATVIMDYTIDWSGPQGKLPPRFLVVDTWIKTEAGWQILQRVSTIKGG